LIADANKTRWQVYSPLEDIYCRQMSSEHKIRDPRDGKQFWVTIGGGTANHFWDCEVLQTFAVDMLNLGAVPAQHLQPAAISASPAEYVQPQRNSWLGTGGSGGGGGWSL
jgi:hypothetical protein